MFGKNKLEGDVDNLYKKMEKCGDDLSGFSMALNLMIKSISECTHKNNLLSVQLSELRNKIGKVEVEMSELNNKLNK